VKINGVISTLLCYGLLASALFAGQLNLAVKQVVVNDHC
jgi:hypothetical protein